MHKISFALSSPPSPQFGPRTGSLLLRRASGNIELPTPTLLVTTSRGVVPHLTQGHAANLPCIQLPFESFLERVPPVPTLQPGPHPLHTFLGYDPAEQLLVLTLRDPHDVRDAPANTDNYVSAVTGRGIRRVAPTQWAVYARTCCPDMVVALPDIPFTSPPFSQKRIERSLTRSASWLSQLLVPSPEPLNVLVHMAGGISTSARRAFAASLKETLYGLEAEAIRPHQCLDDGVTGYVFDLAPLRKEIAAASAEATTRVADLLQASLSSMPCSKLRLVNSVSSPHQILRLIRDVGVDVVDSKWAQDAAAVGVALDFVFPAPTVEIQKRRHLGHNLYRTEYAGDFSPLSSSLSACPCAACQPATPLNIISHSVHDNFAVRDRAQPVSRGYIHHLCLTHEMSAHAMLVLHNIAVMQAFCAAIRHVLDCGEDFNGYVDEFLTTYDEGAALIEEARASWRAVDLARGKGRLMRERNGDEI
ncbi:tRNA-guanine(15) transglycosylase-like protein [Mycena amicta]|nr:tRNA-guanine(15) transglycosylase-like protein [Mycena amicta]